MVSDPGDPPPSWDRRRLLLAFGAGAVNVAVLHQIEVPHRAEASPGTRVSSAPPAGPGAVAGGVDGNLEAASTPTLPIATPPALPGAADAPGPDHVFDLVISGGRVMDPASGFDGLVDVGIDGDRVTALSAVPLIGRRAIDATRRVVAPGFVDLLSAEPNSFGAWLKLADGVTTNLAMHGVNNYARAFFDRYRDQTPIHYGGAFHHHFIRGLDIGARIDLPLGPAQFDRLSALAAENLDQGFAGISFSPEYSPGTSSEEMTGLARVAAERGHVCFFHVRHSDPQAPGTSLEAIDEVLTIAETTGAAVHIEHLTSTGGTYVMPDAIARIEAGRDRGLDVTACLYPYDFWGTFLASARFAPGWQERYGLVEADLQIAGTDIILSPESIGRAVADNQLVAALGSIPEGDVQAALIQPWAMVASDAIPTIGMNNHPRGAGTFARTIGRYVRELGVLDLMTALAKITILPARRVEAMIPSMEAKGRLQRGADADIVVFDPERISDRATVAEPANPSIGIDHVIVAGQIALRDGEPDRSVLAGRPLPGSRVSPSGVPTSTTG